MASVINTNISSLNAQRNLSTSQSSLATSLQRLSSGLRVNSAKDDAAGLGIAERMTAQIKGMNVAIRNANDAISMSQTAEGALSSIGDSLQRMRELAVQAANGTNSEDDRKTLDKEYAQLAEEIKRVADTAAFNGVKLFDAAAETGIAFQVGAGATAATDQITIKSVELLKTGSNVLAVAGTGKTLGTTSTNATDEITKLDAAIKTVADTRATFGAAQNRFTSVISNLQISSENQTAARSRIMDADFAAETANLTRGQILQQAGTAMLAQANSLPNNVLSLLRG